MENTLGLFIGESYERERMKRREKRKEDEELKRNDNFSRVTHT